MEVISRNQEHSWGEQITPLPRNSPALSTHFVAYLAVCRRTTQVPYVGQLRLRLDDQEGGGSTKPCPVSVWHHQL